MLKLKRFLLGGVVTLLLWNQAFALDTFVIREIRIEGLSGISKGTVLNYMPVAVGDTMTEAKSARVIAALYSSGFFTNVSLERQGNTLIVMVAERAAIGSVQVTGNKAIKQDEIKKILKDAGVTVGNVYNRATLQALQQQLQTQYYSMGYYNARVTTNISPLVRNRVAVTINISEGKIAKIREIRFIGNRAFSSHELKKQLIISTPKLWSCITKDDQYSKQKLDASLEKLRSFYMDRGYIRFKIDSTQVSLSPDRQNVYITIHVTEGPQYRFGDFTVSGNTILPIEKIRNLITVVPGQVFSQKIVEQSNQAIALALGDKGYAFAQIDPVATVDEREKTVAINFRINPGSKYYVRRIIFQGNTITADYVLRRSMQQMEGSLLSVRKVRESVRQLNLLGYFKNINVKTVPVPGTTNQVDLVYGVEEQAAGQASVSLGYGTLGFEVSAGINQPNFLGTGRTVGINFDRSSYATTYSINYYNPYYTINNIGRGFTVFYTNTRPGDLNLTDTFAYDSYGASLNYFIPVSLNGNINVSFGYDHIHLKTYPPLTPQTQAFIDNNGTNFNLVTSSASYNYSTLDRAIFPTKGFAGSVGGEFSVPVFKDNLDYYKVGSEANYYLPLNHSRSYILKFASGVGYGNGYGKTKILPILFNYYAGGLSQGLDRAFTTNTLGPKDSNNDPIGGNLLVYYGTSLIFPNYISPDTLRTMLFVEGANVYQTVKNVYGINDLYSNGAGPIRYSAGVAVKWRSPVGPLEFSLAAPLNKRRHDDLEAFQFTMGTSF